MDSLTHELQTFLVRLHYEPSCVSHQVAHYLEHLFHLLPVDQEEALLHYFGILGHGQQSLHEVARSLELTDEAAMQILDENLRRLAVTPEWQMVKQVIQSSK